MNCSNRFERSQLPDVLLLNDAILSERTAQVLRRISDGARMLVRELSEHTAGDGSDFDPRTEEWLSDNPIGAVQDEEINAEAGSATGTSNYFKLNGSNHVHGANMIIPFGTLCAQLLRPAERVISFDRFHANRLFDENVRMFMTRGSKPASDGSEVLVRGSFLIGSGSAESGNEKRERVHFIGTSLGSPIRTLNTVNPIVRSIGYRMAAPRDDGWFALQCVGVPDNPQRIQDPALLGLHAATYLSMINGILGGLMQAGALDVVPPFIQSGVKTLQLPDPHWLARGDGSIRLRVQTGAEISALKEGMKITPIEVIFSDVDGKTVGSAEVSFATGKAQPAEPTHGSEISAADRTTMSSLLRQRRRGAVPEGPMKREVTRRLWNRVRPGDDVTKVVPLLPLLLGPLWHPANFEMIAQVLYEILYPMGTIRNDDSTQKTGPNTPCPCGSGKKYKKCCGKRA